MPAELTIITPKAIEHWVADRLEPADHDVITSFLATNAEAREVAAHFRRLRAAEQ